MLIKLILLSKRLNRFPHFSEQCTPANINNNKTFLCLV